MLPDPQKLETQVHLAMVVVVQVDVVVTKCVYHNKFIIVLTKSNSVSIGELVHEIIYFCMVHRAFMYNSFVWLETHSYLP